MALTLYFHPLASFCHKVLIALYEHGTPFTGHLVDLGDRNASATVLDLWPVGKIPVLHDAARSQTVPETTVIIEYLEQHYPGAVTLLSAEPAARLDARLWDRFFDNYVQVPMAKIVTDRLRAEHEHDARGVADARATLGVAYDMLDKRMADRTWVAGSAFSLADCAAAPGLFYANIVAPFPAKHERLAAYFERLLARASVQRSLAEARPWFHLFPYREAIPERFL
jgi:glutathione S-transferase